ncbi:MAG: UDP-N-acetylglucosamine--N-acetylmuramyl-(pentapeptide) pyrophosphoryl-undecaprenol N-acetylglucosamine transferase [Candidatus Bathyarchaeia archaeon]
MRVQFAPSGVGLGHAGRCIPIARGLQKKDKKTEIFFSTYLDAVSYVRQEGFPTIEVPPMDFKVKPDGTVDFRGTAMNPGPFVAPFNFLEQVGKEIEVMATFEPDVVVSDSRASPIVAARMLGIPTLCILNQFQVIIPRKTHYLRLAKFADAITLAIIGKIWTTGIKVLIPDFPPPYTISTDNLRIPKAYRKKIELIGPILPIRPDALPTTKELRKRLGLSDEKPVIFAPISGPLKERAYLIRILQRIFAGFPDDYQIVMSLGYPKSHATPVHYGNFTVFRWVPNRFEYMKACNIVISRAGHGTVLQTICYGKPTILIPTPSHTEQLNNAKKGVELGVAMMIEQENINKEVLLSTIREIMKEECFSARAMEIQQEVSAIDGLETAIETTLEVAEGGKTHVYA